MTEEKRNIARALVKMEMAVDQIVEITQLTAEEIKTLYP